MNLKLDSVI